MHPGKLLIEDFSYLLPAEKIAKFPLPERDQSKLLVYKDGVIEEDVYSNICSHLPANSLLVFNNTRVIEARLLFQKPTGGVIEVFALEPHHQYPDILSAMSTAESVWWKCLIGGAGKWKHGHVLNKQLKENGATIQLEARIVERMPDSFTIEFSWDPPHLSFAEILYKFGSIPIPPYLKRETSVVDKERYQTIYANTNGSVAAPTAGLHFTEKTFQSLKAKNILPAFMTLHVGAGTFMPVKTAAIGDHRMHAEFLQVDIPFIQQLAEHPADIFAVGTTSLRTLESLYWMGVKCCNNPAIQKNDLEIKQWEIYDEPVTEEIAAGKALTALLDWLKKNTLQELVIKTSIMIAPPYSSKIVRGIITNFHQPNSTLLVLIAALIGAEWRKVYKYALENDFRFLSYGDGCLLYAGDRYEV